MYDTEGTTILVFLQYNENQDWFGRELLSTGKIVIAVHDVIFSVGENEPNWDEIIAVMYSNKNTYSEAIDQLNAQKGNLKNLRVQMLNPLSQEQMEKTHALMEKYATSGLDMTPGDENFKEPPGGINSTTEQAELMFNRDKTIPLVMVIYNKYFDKAQYPDDYTGEKKENGREAYFLYGMTAFRYQGLVESHVYLAGKYHSTIIGENQVWDDFNIVRYEDRNAMVKMYSLKRVQESLVHRHAGLEKTIVFATTPYDEFL